MNEHARTIVDKIKEGYKEFDKNGINPTAQACTLSHDTLFTLINELEQLERERDAAVKGLGKMRWCSMCKNSGTDDLTCITCKYPQDVYPTFRPNWQWRGVEVE